VHLLPPSILSLSFSTPLSLTLLTGYFVLEYPFSLDILLRDILTEWIFGTGIALLSEYFVLGYPY
jgi:hypothetical protein